MIISQSIEKIKSMTPFGKKPSLLMSKRGSFIRRRIDTPVQFEIKKGDFLVTMASSLKDIKSIYKLRYQVFQREYAKKKIPIGIDKDRFDIGAEYIIVKHLFHNKIVATYRLRNSDRISQFYSSTEFDLDGLGTLEGTKVELSRACVHKDFRKTYVLHLLWMGLSRYMKESQASYLFGLSSIQGVELSDLKNCFLGLMRMKAFDQNNLKPHTSYRVEGFQDWYHQTQEEFKSLDPKKISRSHVPTLLKSYIRAGALITPEPALDKKMNCLDLFTLMKVNHMNHGYKKRYQLDK